MKNYTGTVIFFLLIFLFQCQVFGQEAGKPDETPPSVPQPSVQPDKNLVQQSSETLKGIEKTKAAYFFDPRGKRDPFQSPYMEAKGATIISEEEKMGFEGIRQFKTSALQLTGIIIKDKEHIAMVKAPDGKVYMLREDSKVGPGGVVKKISQSKMVIEEEFTIKESDDFGNISTKSEKREVVMSLGKI